MHSFPSALAVDVMHDQCVMFPSPWLPCYDGLEPKLRVKISLFSTKLLFVRVFNHINRNKTRIRRMCETLTKVPNISRRCGVSILGRQREMSTIM